MKAPSKSVPRLRDITGDRLSRKIPLCSIFREPDHAFFVIQIKRYTAGYHILVTVGATHCMKKTKQLSQLHRALEANQHWTISLLNRINFVACRSRLIWCVTTNSTWFWGKPFVPNPLRILQAATAASLVESGSESTYISVPEISAPAFVTRFFWPPHYVRPFSPILVSSPSGRMKIFRMTDYCLKTVLDHFLWNRRSNLCPASRYPNIVTLYGNVLRIVYGCWST